MKLPGSNRNYQTHVAFGRYVAARMRQAKREEQASDVEAACAVVKDKGRAWEDATEGFSTRTATRDAVDDELDNAAKLFRRKLASRSTDAERKAPYTAIFPKGIGYYTAAPLAENVQRYRELLARAEANLQAQDPDLVELRAALSAGTEEFPRAEAALADARTQAGIARTALEASIDAWAVQMERTYGTLAAELGRRVAERFFPRRTAGTGDTDTPVESGDHEPPSPA